MIPVPELPESMDDLQNFCHQLYVHKVRPGQEEMALFVLSSLSVPLSNIHFHHIVSMG